MEFSFMYPFTGFNYCKIKSVKFTGKNRFVSKNHNCCCHEEYPFSMSGQFSTVVVVAAVPDLQM